jgi:hypothetical protein
MHSRKKNQQQTKNEIACVDAKIEEKKTLTYANEYL